LFAVPNVALTQTAGGTQQTPPPLGKLVDVGGHRVHLYCVGTGNPTVVIQGAGYSFDWGLVQPKIAAITQAAEKLEQLGINSTQTFIEATSTNTVKRQGEIWLKTLSSRKRNPLEQTTIDTRRYALDKRIYPFFEGKLLADVNNLAMRDFVEHVSKLAPATIRDYSNIVKAIVASAIDDRGETLFPRSGTRTS
jgi:hypothetical protein